MSLSSLRQVSPMASIICSPFSRAVFSAMRKIYPEDLADKSFDNTGLLLEAPFSPKNKLRNSVLLTIDLTSAVAQEAIERKTSVVVTYHPIIFRGLKNLTLANSQQRSLLRLAAEGISIYCPHTAVDAAVGGNADWMADIITGTGRTAKNLSDSTSPDSKGCDNRFGQYHPARNYELFSFPRAESIDRVDIALGSWPHHRTVVSPNKANPSAGAGRVVQFSEPRPLSIILEVITTYFLQPRAFSVACAYGKRVSDIEISTVGICAGSGYSIVGEVEDVDLIVTGELSHHEVLAAVESGKSVIAFGHSNSERGFLAAVMRGKLQSALEAEWNGVREDGLMQLDGDDRGVLEQMFQDPSVEVSISQADRDPFQTAIWLPVGSTR